MEVQAASSGKGLVGTVIAEKYEVLSLIASGGAGDVYKVRHMDLNQIRAAKVLRMSLRAKEDPLLRLQREARTLCSLKDPNVVSVHAMDFDQKAGFIIIMDYIEGRNLSTFIAEQGRLSPQLIRNLATQICSGLQAVHENGILHRDLKPSNVMIEGDATNPKAILIDFGLAKFQDKEQKLTQTGAFIGTPLYISPEQCLSRPMDIRSDIYSFGCLLYEMMTGKPPFVANTTIELMSMHIGVEPEFPSSIRPEMAELDEIVMTALQKEPSERYADTAELLRALRKDPSYTPRRRKRPADLGLPDLERSIPQIALVLLILIAWNLFGGLIKSKRVNVAPLLTSVTPRPQLTKSMSENSLLMAISRAEGQLGDDHGAYNNRWLLAQLYKRDGRYLRAKAQFENMDRYCEKGHLTRSHELDRADLYIALSQQERSLQSSQQVLGRNIDSDKQLALELIARAENGVGDFDKAYATSLLALQCAHKDEKRKLAAEQQMARACIGLNRFNEALEILERCSVYHQTKDESSKYLTTGLKAIALNGVGQTESAEQQLRQFDLETAEKTMSGELSADEEKALAKLQSMVQHEFERTAAMRHE